MRAIERFCAGLALFTGAGCTPASGESDGPPGEAAGAAFVPNGLHLNGLHLNGIHLNGLHLNGIHLNGLQLDGPELSGSHVNDSQVMNLRLAGARLVRAGRGEAPLDLAGATFAATLSDGSPVALRVDAVSPGATPDVLRYAVSWALAGSDAFAPLCGTDDGAPALAIPLRGTWDESSGTPTGGAHVDDPSVFTFACEGHALAKCVELGYAPWRRAVECRPQGGCHLLTLAPLHQACTRLLRADYCGDGTATTREGTVVDAWDALSVQRDEAPSWTFEAEWGASGAACVAATRWATFGEAQTSVQGYIAEHCPERWQPEGCGAPSSTFFVANGFSVPASLRPMLRSRVAPALPTP